MKRFVICLMAAISLLFLEASRPVPYESISLYARGAILMDASNGRVLYEKNGYEAMPNASTTKIMTCILALESGRLEKEVEVSDNAASQPKVKCYLESGEHYLLKDLLYSLMLESHNDTAVAIAEFLGGDTDGFAVMMNDKARELGCRDTFFITPNGLDAIKDGRVHSTTAYDLGLMTAYALQNDMFCKIIATKSATIWNVEGTRAHELYNKDSFLDMYEGSMGVKTGYTAQAGYCFVGAARQNGGTFISVCLGSGWPPNKGYKWEDTRKLMEYGKKYFRQSTKKKDADEVEIPVENGIKDSLAVEVPAYSVTCLMAEKDEFRVELSLPESVEAPVYEGDKVGEVLYLVNGIVVSRSDLTAGEEIEVRSYPYYYRMVFRNFFHFSEKSIW